MIIPMLPVSTLLGKKRIVLYGALIVVLLFSAAYVLFPPQLKLSYVLDSAHLAETEPQGTWGNMTCPQCGSRLEQIVITPVRPQTADAPYRFALYCRQEDIFWIMDCTGWSVGWYGPFDARWRVTNTVAITIAVVSGVALISLVIRDGDLMTRRSAQRLVASKDFSIRK